MAERKVLLDALAHERALFLEKDAKHMAELAGGSFCAPSISLSYLRETLRVDAADAAIDPLPATITEQILVYKYLREAQGMAGPDDTYIAFMELPNGGHHQAAFREEVLRPIAARFGADAEGFRAAALALGGEAAPGGDVSYRFRFFPKLGLQVILWLADEEFPARSAVLFDRKCHFHLDTDALGNAATVLAERLTAQ